MIAIKGYEILHIIFVTSVILFTLDLIAAFLVAQYKVQEAKVGFFFLMWTTVKMYLDIFF